MEAVAQRRSCGPNSVGSSPGQVDHRRGLYRVTAILKRGTGTTMKAERERAALDQVYGAHEFKSLHHGDRPDFVLRYRGADSAFGVEVTELYETEADARAELHPGYIGELLAGGRHMHKHDASVLKVEKVQLQDEDGKLKAADLPAIIREKPSADEHAHSIAQILRRKTEQATGYRQDLSHVNLLIVDRLGAQRWRGDTYPTNQLLVPDLKEALVASPFREVFLVSTDNDWRVYRPLQMLLLIESFELFLGAVATFESSAAVPELPDELPLFVHTVKTMGAELHLGRYANDSECAVYRGCGVRLGPDTVRVLDFADRDAPPDLPAPAPVWPVELVSAFMEHHARFVEASVFTVGLAIPTKAGGAA